MSRHNSHGAFIKEDNTDGQAQAEGIYRRISVSTTEHRDVPAGAHGTRPTPTAAPMNPPERRLAQSVSHPSGYAYEGHRYSPYTANEESNRFHETTVALQQAARDRVLSATAAEFAPGLTRCTVSSAPQSSTNTNLGRYRGNNTSARAIGGPVCPSRDGYSYAVTLNDYVAPSPADESTRRAYGASAYNRSLALSSLTQDSRWHSAFRAPAQLMRTEPRPVNQFGSAESSVPIQRKFNGNRANRFGAVQPAGQPTPAGVPGADTGPFDSYGSARPCGLWSPPGVSRTPGQGGQHRDDAISYVGSKGVRHSLSSQLSDSIGIMTPSSTTLSSSVAPATQANNCSRPNHVRQLPPVQPIRQPRGPHNAMPHFASQHDRFARLRNEQQPGVFHPMKVAMNRDGATSSTSRSMIGNSTPEERRLHGFSPNYQGNIYIERNRSADIPATENCAIWLTNLPPDITHRDLFAAMEGKQFGRVWAVHLNAPEPERNHLCSAAKVIFFEKAGAQRIYQWVNVHGLYIRGHRAKISFNRIKVAEASDPGHVSRVLMIYGPQKDVHPDVLEPILRPKIEFYTDVWQIHPAKDGTNMVVVEWRFARYHCQAQAVMSLLAKEHPKVPCYYGPDPCA